VRAPVLGIVGPGATARPDDLRNAEELARLAAVEQWVVASGGVASGVMEAASRGARAAGGIVLGILPGAETAAANEHVTIAVATSLGQARNNVLVLTSDVVAVCGISAGTASEVALALRAGRPLVFIAADHRTEDFYAGLPPDGTLAFVRTPEEALGAVLRPVAARIVSAGPGAH
jgi:uncharacterized protein (TIGR00725 family)